jgi:LmbE family N-acetylglucosaminyl deacetylase
LTINVPQSAMVIVAHPDDPEFFCGGTIALWCANGTEIRYLILTNGNKGSDDPDMTPEKLAAIRKEEQQAAADVLGVKQVIYFDEPDGELEHTRGLRQRVVSEIRRYQPEVVITLDPSRYFAGDRYINHADHRAAGEVAIDAIFPAARNRMYHPELLNHGLEPHTVKEVYLSGANEPNLWVDVSAVFDTKIAAIRCHASQIKDPDDLHQRIKERSIAADQYGRDVLHEEFRVMRIG